MPVDRLAPTRRPEGPPLGFQKWRHLLFLHWEVPVEALQPLLPPGLTVDVFEDRACVGLVPFTMRDVRPLRFLPAIPGTAHFHETNVRLYVLHKGQDPGVFFLSLDAANRLAVFAARTFFHLPYYYADMDLRLESAAAVRYRSQRRAAPSGLARLHARYTIGAPLPASVPGTLQFFLAERYYLYTLDAQRRLVRGQVHHPPYPLHGAAIDELSESLIEAAGIKKGAPLPLTLYSPGVDVEIFGLERV
ncbi:MAG: DUF2071 domain-containing protein [Polyangia bacterium]